MEVVHGTPTEQLSEQLSVRRLTDELGLTQMRSNVWTLAEGSMMRHAHREQEELYLVLEGMAQIDVEGSLFKLGAHDVLAVPAHAEHQLSNVGVGPLTFFAVAAPNVKGDGEKR